tara:strand:+ start:996 stop:1733 length:738 start_codon:yes stop_codon:yes gene_type:complete
MVSIDTVYQRVLMLANKEQRGYITPQEFNLLANQVQMEIFDQYFHDIKQSEKAEGSDQEYSDVLSMLYAKIGMFEMERGDIWMVNNMLNAIGGLNIPNEIYKIGNVKIGTAIAELLNTKDFELTRVSPLTAPNIERPIAAINSFGLLVAIGPQTPTNNGLAIPGTGLNMSISYMRKPRKVEWSYVIVNDKPLYNANMAIDFELHASEETRLVYKILKLAGITLKAAEIVQVGQTLEVEKLQQEKN